MCITVALPDYFLSGAWRGPQLCLYHCFLNVLQVPFFIENQTIYLISFIIENIKNEHNVW